MKSESVTVPNRVAPPLVVPETAEGRQAQYSRTLAAAVAFLESRITSGDVEAAERAVAMLFDLEKTRLRHDRAIHGVPESKAKSTTAMLPPMERPSPVVRSLRDRIDDAPEEKDTRSAAKLTAPSSPSSHGVTGPQFGAFHARTRSILLRRLAEVDPGRVWSDAEVDRMLAQLEVLHREHTGD